MSYPPALTYYLDRLQGFSTNIFRLESQNNDTATANKILRFSLPANALLNMRTFALHFNAKTTATGQGARLPAKIDTLIERVEVTAGGVQLSQGLNNYNVLRHAKDALHAVQFLLRKLAGEQPPHVIRRAALQVPQVGTDAAAE